MFFLAISDELFSFGWYEKSSVFLRFLSFTFRLKFPQSVKHLNLVVHQFHSQCVFHSQFRLSRLLSSPSLADAVCSNMIMSFDYMIVWCSKNIYTWRRIWCLRGWRGEERWWDIQRDILWAAWKVFVAEFFLGEKKDFLINSIFDEWGSWPLCKHVV